MHIIILTSRCLSVKVSFGTLTTVCVFQSILFHFKSSSLLTIIYKCTKHYNYLQTHLHLLQPNLRASKLIKTLMYRHKVIKNAKLVKARIKLKLFIDLGLMKQRSLCTDVFQVIFPSPKCCMT
jgi:hypothetical protein